jgi:hypothetical protein
MKRCGCGCEYTPEQWQALPYVGVMRDDVEALELRNCVCGSTLAVEMTMNCDKALNGDRCDCDECEASETKRSAEFRPEYDAATPAERAAHRQSMRDASEAA